MGAALAPAGCARRAPDGRVEASLWFAYGGNNRKVLLALVDQFHAAQDRFRIHATYQGDYFEALAKLRTALAARAAPTLTHVIGEVVPYLAEAGVLEPLDAFFGGSEPSIRAAARASASSPRWRRSEASPAATRGLWSRCPSTARRPSPTTTRPSSATSASRRRPPGTRCARSPPGPPSAMAAASRRAGASSAPSTGGSGSPWSARPAARSIEADGTPTLGGESRRARARAVADARARRPHHEAAARARLQRVAGRQHRFPRRARRDDLDLDGVPPLPRRERAVRGGRRPAAARGARLGAHGRHLLRDAQGPAARRAGGGVRLPPLDDGARAGQRLGDAHRLHPRLARRHRRARGERLLPRSPQRPRRARPARLRRALAVGAAISSASSARRCSPGSRRPCSPARTRAPCSTRRAAWRVEP